MTEKTTNTATSTIHRTLTLASTLVVADVVANVKIVPSNSPEIRVIMEGESRDIEAITTGTEGDACIIRGKPKASSIIVNDRGSIIINAGTNFGIIGSTRRGSVTICDNGNTVSFGDGDIVGNTIKKSIVNITVQIPPEVRVIELTNIIGDITVGDVNAILTTYLSGYASLAVDSARDVDLNLSGAVKVNIQNMIGDLDAELSGSCNLTVARAEIGRIHMNLSGCCAAVIHGCAKTSHVTANGMSQVSIDRVIRPIRRNTSGMSTVNITHVGQ